MEYENRWATNGKANAALTTGIIGTAGVGLTLLSNLMNGSGAAGWNGNGGCSENTYVNRYELSMVRDLQAKDMEIAYLRGRDEAKSDSLEVYRYIDGKISGVERELADQRVFNASQIGTISCLQGQISQLMTLTKLTIPNGSVCPGWGDVNVSVTPATAASA